MASMGRTKEGLIKVGAKVIALCLLSSAMAACGGGGGGGVNSTPPPPPPPPPRHRHRHRRHRHRRRRPGFRRSTCSPSQATGTLDVVGIEAPGGGDANLKKTGVFRSPTTAPRTFI